MANPQQLLQGMIGVCSRNIPNFNIQYKDEHFSQKLLGFILRWVLPFNRAFMSKYTTTFYPHVYFPSHSWMMENPMRAFKILAHEYVHLWEEKERGRWAYKLAYASPQVFAALSLLAFFAFLWTPMLWALVFFVFALPWPSIGRRNIERRGYLMSFAVNYWRYGSVMQEQIDHVLDQFTKSYYYFMWPLRKWMLKLLWKDIQTLKDKTIFVSRYGAPYMHVHEVLITDGAVNK